MATIPSNVQVHMPGGRALFLQLRGATLVNAIDRARGASLHFLAPELGDGHTLEILCSGRIAPTGDLGELHLQAEDSNDIDNKRSSPLPIGSTVAEVEISERKGELILTFDDTQQLPLAYGDLDSDRSLCLIWWEGEPDRSMEMGRVPFPPSMAERSTAYLARSLVEIFRFIFTLLRIPAAPVVTLVTSIFVLCLPFWAVNTLSSASETFPLLAFAIVPAEFSGVLAGALCLPRPLRRFGSLILSLHGLIFPILPLLVPADPSNLRQDAFLWLLIPAAIGAAGAIRLVWKKFSGERKV